jgi:hypothetical protein
MSTKVQASLTNGQATTSVLLTYRSQEPLRVLLPLVVAQTTQPSLMSLPSQLQRRK